VVGLHTVVLQFIQIGTMPVVATGMPQLHSCSSYRNRSGCLSIRSRSRSGGAAHSVATAQIDRGHDCSGHRHGYLGRSYFVVVEVGVGFVV
jgi:hypothetical protein